MCQAMAGVGVIEVYEEFAEEGGEENFCMGTAVVSKESGWEVYRVGGVCSGDV